MKNTLYSMYQCKKNTYNKTAMAKTGLHIYCPMWHFNSYIAEKFHIFTTQNKKSLNLQLCSKMTQQWISMTSVKCMKFFPAKKGRGINGWIGQNK